MVYLSGRTGDGQPALSLRLEVCRLHHPRLIQQPLGRLVPFEKAQSADNAGVAVEEPDDPGLCSPLGLLPELEQSIRQWLQRFANGRVVELRPLERDAFDQQGKDLVASLLGAFAVSPLEQIQDLAPPVL